MRMNITCFSNNSDGVLFDLRDDDSDAIVYRFMLRAHAESGIELAEVQIGTNPKEFIGFGNGHDIVNRGILGFEAQLRSYVCVDHNDARRAGKIVFGYTDYSYNTIRQWIHDRVIAHASRDWKSQVCPSSEESVSFDLSKIKDLYAVMNDGTKISITNNILKVSK